MPFTVVDNKLFVVVDKLLLNYKKGVRKGMLNVAPEIQKEVRRRIFDPPKTGRIYSIGGRPHQASAPGESPANLSGELARSVAYRVAGSTRLIIGYRAEVADYGRWLEGNQHSPIAPRPALKPATISKARDIEQHINIGVQEEIGKVHT